MVLCFLLAYLAIEWGRAQLTLVLIVDNKICSYDLTKESVTNSFLI
jgi:hypothetical protein